MIEIQIDDRVKKVSTEMTIRQYKKYFNNKTKYEGNPLMMLSLLVDEPVDVLRDLPKNQVDFVLNYLSDEITKNPMGDLVMTFEHDGIKYGLENDWSNLAWGAWVDLEILSSEDIDNNIDHILAVMYRPVLTNKGTDYTIESYKSKSVLTRKKIFEDLPVKYWFNFAGFFFQIVKIYISDINNSLKLTNKMNRLILKTHKKLPKYLREKVSLDSILVSPSTSQTTTLPKSNR